MTDRPALQAQLIAARASALREASVAISRNLLMVPGDKREAAWNHALSHAIKSVLALIEKDGEA